MQETSIYKIEKKLRSNSGESIAETLVAVLIVALGLLVLAGSVVSAYNIITGSNKKMQTYSEAQNNVVEQITKTGTGELSSFGKVDYYVNDTFGSTPVVSFKMHVGD